MVGTPNLGVRGTFATSLGPPWKAPRGTQRHTLHADRTTYVSFGAVPKLLLRLIPGSGERAEARWADARCAEGQLQSEPTG